MGPATLAAMSQRATATRQYSGVQGFPGGVNSGVDPLLLSDNQVRWAINAVCKGGIWQTRPGFKTRATLSTGFAQISNWWISAGKPGIWPQFMCYFSPRVGTDYLVFGLSGSVWFCSIASDRTLSAPTLIPGLNFNPDVEQMFWAVTTKSADLVDGVVQPVAAKKYLILQDGVSRACYWDGINAGQLNPEQRWTQDTEGNLIYAAGYNQTPIGKYMAWSGNRLWVSNGTQVFASDLNDPLNFTEQITFVNVPVVNFPDEVTGLFDRGTSGTSRSQLLVFTTNSVWAVASGVQARTDWRSTADWQAKIFTGTGCLAHKSIIAHRGLLYWYGADGIVRFDGSGTVNSTQALPPVDTELVQSKVSVVQSKRGLINAGSLDSYMAMSVPAGKPAAGRVVCGQTQVLDADVLAGSNLRAWQGIWTGINPVEWATVQRQGQNICYALSYDDDGVVRIWEAFRGSRSDNGYQIPWSIETKAHMVSQDLFANHKIAHIATALSELQGNVAVRGYWRGIRGQYHSVLDTLVTATPGSVLIPDLDFTPIVNSTEHYSCRKQVRTLRSEDIRGPQTDTDASGVEGPYTDSVSPSFQLLFRMLGSGAIRAYRIAHELWPDNTEGEVVNPEAGLNILPASLGIDPWHKDSELPTYVLADQVPAAAFAATDMTYEEEEYASPPVDDFSAGYAELGTNPVDQLYFNFFRIVATPYTVEEDGGEGQIGYLEAIELELGDDNTWYPAETAADNGHYLNDSYYAVANAIDGRVYTGTERPRYHSPSAGFVAELTLKYTSPISARRMRWQPHCPFVTQRGPRKFSIYGSNTGAFSGEQILINTTAEIEPNWQTGVWRTFNLY